MAVKRVVFLGDSDISRWPPSIYPSIIQNTTTAAAAGEDCHLNCVNVARGGAVMSDMLNQLKEWRDSSSSSTSSNVVDNNTESTTTNNNNNKDDGITIYIACAGENDISSGQSIDKIQHSFSSFLTELFRPKKQNLISNDGDNTHFLILLGPKLEPWLTNDHTSRKQYTKLSTALQRIIRKSPDENNIVYVDCLTMFCTTESKDVPGAIHGGRAIPDRQYFDSDELHLSDEGYKVWKEVVDEKIQSIILCNTILLKKVVVEIFMI